MKKKLWHMPAWMEPYRSLIQDTGGNSIEDLMNDDGRNSNVVVNAPRALICVAVKAQVNLLYKLREAKKLPPEPLALTAAQLSWLLMPGEYVSPKSPQLRALIAKGAVEVVDPAGYDRHAKAKIRLTDAGYAAMKRGYK